MKNTPEELAEAFSYVHDFDNGTFSLDKTGDLKYGENYIATFLVGYGQHKFQGEADNIAGAIKLAIAKIPNSPLYKTNE